MSISLLLLNVCRKKNQLRTFNEPTCDYNTFNACADSRCCCCLFPSLSLPFSLDFKYKFIYFFFAFVVVRQQLRVVIFALQISPEMKMIWDVETIKRKVFVLLNFINRIYQSHVLVRKSIVYICSVFDFYR